MTNQELINLKDLFIKFQSEYNSYNDLSPELNEFLDEVCNLIIDTNIPL